MEDHSLLVYFDRYCKTCPHIGLNETEPPCDECLEHPVNIDTHKPFCYFFA